MCGRYYRKSGKQKIAEAFKLGNLPDDFVLPADYNVAPTTFHPIIRNDKETGDCEAVMIRWELVTMFIKGLLDVKCIITINSRADSDWRRA